MSSGAGRDARRFPKCITHCDESGIGGLNRGVAQGVQKPGRRIIGAWTLNHACEPFRLGMTSVRATLSGLLCTPPIVILFPLEYPLPVPARNDKTLDDRVVGSYIVCAPRC